MRRASSYGSFLAVPQLKALHLPHRPALVPAVVTAPSDKTNKTSIAATNTSLEVLCQLCLMLALQDAGAMVGLFTRSCCMDWCWVPGVMGH